MKIEVGKYTINSDDCCLWITERVKTKDGSKTEHVEKKVAGYSPNAEMLLDSFVNHKSRGSSAREVQKYLTDMAKVERDCKRLFSKL
mgnify:CR=1 FL=1